MFNYFEKKTVECSYYQNCLFLIVMIYVADAHHLRIDANKSEVYSNKRIKLHFASKTYVNDHILLLK